MATQTYTVDPAHSDIGFSVRHLVVSKVRGHFARWTAQLSLDIEDLSQSSVSVEVDVASIDTKNADRDGHLRSADFFDVKNHPEVRFVSESATLEGETLKVRGRLYAAGKSLPLELDASLRPVGDELEVEARTYADHRQLAMSHRLLGMIPTPSELIVHGRLVPDPADEHGPPK